jgi:hypothetical protein
MGAIHASRVAKGHKLALGVLHRVPARFLILAAQPGVSFAQLGVEVNWLFQPTWRALWFRVPYDRSRVSIWRRFGALKIADHRTVRAPFSKRRIPA